MPFCSHEDVLKKAKALDVAAATIRGSALAGRNCEHRDGRRRLQRRGQAFAGAIGAYRLSYRRAGDRHETEYEPG